MKKAIFKKILAVCASACTMLSALTVPVFAEKAEKKDLLPCGRPLSWLQNEINNFVNDHLGPDGQTVNLPSFSMVLFKGDEVLYQGIFGEIDMKNHIPADEETVYEWGSISKTMIWVSAMQLWEQGRLDLEKDIREYLPEGFFRHLQFDDPITMLNLMNHTAGWDELTYKVSTNHSDKIRPLKQVLQETEPAQSYRPGEISAYSNWGAALGAYVIECITGEDFCQYVHKNILDRLGMAHTAIAPDHSDNAWVSEQRKKVQCYEHSMIFGVRSIGGKNDYIELYPCGSLTGTLSDLLIYAQALLDDSAPLFDDPATQQEMFSGSAFYGETDIPTNTHGFWQADYAVTVTGHNGGTGGFTAEMWFDRETKYGYISLTNQYGGNDMFDWIMLSYLGEIPKGKYGSDQSGPKIEFTGYYLPSRSEYHGIASYLPYLQATHMDHLECVYDLGNGLCCTGDGTTLVQRVKYSNGREGIHLGGGDYIKDPLFSVKISLFAAYVLLAVIAVFVLLSKRKLIKAGRMQQNLTERVIIISQICNIISVLGLLLAPTIANFGIPRPFGVMIGVLQMLCLAVFAAAVIVSVMQMIKRAPQKWRYISMTVWSAIVAGTILCFHTYQFWGC